MNGIEGLRAVVSGGASGIGAAIVARLRADGARVGVFDVTATDDPDAFVVDVTDDASVRAAVDAAARAFGGIDVVVNNAGIGALGTVEDNPDDEWRRVFEVNVLGAVRMSRAALPWLQGEAERAHERQDEGFGFGQRGAGRTMCRVLGRAAP